MRNLIIVAAGLMFVFMARAGFADTEAPNQPHVTAEPYGQCYVKSVPADHWGTKGTTRLYKVRAEEDELVATFDWFSQEIRLNCHVMRGTAPGISVVQIGPWARGDKATDEDLALALYFNGEQLATYTNLDIAGTADNVDASVSHYSVFRKIGGFRYTQASDGQEFVIETTDGRTIAFDAATGERR